MNEPDDLLFILFQEHNDDAYNKLYNRHKKIIRKIIKKYYFVLKTYQIDFNEIYLECNLNYIRALKKYSVYRDISLDTYIYSCLEKGIISYIRKYKNNILEDIDIFDDSNLLDILYSTKLTPYNELQKKELIESIKNDLSRGEISIFNLIIKGIEYDEIADYLNISKKQLYNSINRIRNKTKIIMDF